MNYSIDPDHETGTPVQRSGVYTVNLKISVLIPESLYRDNGVGYCLGASLYFCDCIQCFLGTIVERYIDKGSQ
jgi:hypothetical protein